MATVKITKRNIEGLRKQSAADVKATGAREAIVWDEELAGLGLRVGASGVASWLIYKRLGAAVKALSRYVLSSLPMGRYRTLRRPGTRLGLSLKIFGMESILTRVRGKPDSQRLCSTETASSKTYGKHGFLSHGLGVRPSASSLAITGMA